MIVRVMAEGQYRVDPEQFEQLHALDDALLEELEAGNQAKFQALLQQAVAVARAGEKLSAEELTPSDLILPPPDISLAEAKRWLESEA